MKTVSGANRATEPVALAFIDLAGFSAIADVFGDEAAMRVLERFESIVGQSTGASGRLVKWIGDEAMLAFPDADAALEALGRILGACRDEAAIPLTRASLHCGPAIARGGDLFGATVNLAARMNAIAEPGQLLATEPVAEAARARGIAVDDLGEFSLRSIASPVRIFSLALAAEVDKAWIDPVCKMHAPFAAYRAGGRETPWFCSPRCAEMYARSPGTYR